jgi:hypothetical protein
VLRLLACSPRYSRLGAGSALLRRGFELADREGLNTWLEASPAGYSLYKKLGFKDLDVQDLPVSKNWGAVKLDGDNWGDSSAVDLAGPLAPGHYRSVLMKREPVSNIN